MSTPSNVRKRRLGEILQNAGLITDVQLAAALAEQKKWGGKLGRTLVEMGFVDEQSMTIALSRQLQLPLIDLDSAPIPGDAVQLMAVDIAERYGVFPIGGDLKSKSVIVATSDPTNMDQLRDLAFRTGLKVQLAVATGSSIDRAIRRHYYGESTVASDTTTPHKLGVSEAEFGEAELSNPRGKALAEGGSAAASDQTAELASQVAQLSQRLGELEKLVSGQVRAMRGVVELLLEKGLVTKDEYLARVRRD